MKIKVRNKIIFETFDHYIYEKDLSDFLLGDVELKVVEIDKDNIDKAGNAVGNTTRKWIMKDYPYAHGYYFVDRDGNNVGSCWVMDKGGDEKLYRIRNHDSFIFRVEIEEEYRGKGYAKQMMNMIFNLIKEKGCTNTCLVCATKNIAANTLYERLNMNRVGRRKFVRLFDRNLPYHSI